MLTNDDISQEKPARRKTWGRMSVRLHCAAVPAPLKLPRELPRSGNPRE